MTWEVLPMVIDTHQLYDFTWDSDGGQVLQALTTYASCLVGITSLLQDVLRCVMALACSSCAAAAAADICAISVEASRPENMPAGCSTEQHHGLYMVSRLAVSKYIHACRMMGLVASIWLQH